MPRPTPVGHNLQITGTFEILTVTERISTCCPCVVTNRTGAGRRLYMTTSVDAQTGNVRRLDGVLKERPGTVRCRQILHRWNKFSRAMMYISISSFATMPPKTGCQNKRRSQTLPLVLSRQIVSCYDHHKKTAAPVIALVRCIFIIRSLRSAINKFFIDNHALHNS